ncbi:MAG: hypothetical protein Tsb0034_12160 [Ekhidna sp.]
MTFGQSAQAEYLEAKRQFNLGNYSIARQAFGSLTADNNFGPYASFYYALSALKQGDKKTAYDMWKQTKRQFPQWDKQQEVDYWLGYVAFSQKRYWEAFNHISSLPEDQQSSLIRNELGDRSLEELTEAHAQNPDNKHIAAYLAKAIMNQPYSERDHYLLNELLEKFDISLATGEVALPTIKKPKYSVAAVLPFMFDSLGNPQSVIRNSIIFDLYQGMEMAVDELERLKMPVELYPFDTKKREATTRQLVLSGNLNNADVIVGPLFGGPNSVIASFSKDKKITMINPLSSNEEIIGDNPFSFLFKPAYSTQGRVVAEYAKATFTENKKAFIFYETDRDSLVANAYREAIEQEGFFIIRFERLTNESAQQIQKDFIEQYEVRLDTDFTIQEIDSIGLIPGRYVKTRPLRNKKDGSIILDDRGKEVTEYYENRFKVADDSIGHIFAATSSNLLANNFISLSEVRSDTVSIIGYDDWLDFSLVSYDQLERLGIALISTDFVDDQSPTYTEVRKKFIKKMGMPPGEYHIIGYELMMQLGKLLHERGKYFQKGLQTGEFIPGLLMEGMRYGPYNDNQVVPVVKLENLRLMKQEIKKGNEN